MFFLINPNDSLIVSDTETDTLQMDIKPFSRTCLEECVHED